MVRDSFHKNLAPWNWLSYLENWWWRDFRLPLSICIFLTSQLPPNSPKAIATWVIFRFAKHMTKNKHKLILQWLKQPVHVCVLLFIDFGLGAGGGWGAGDSQPDNHANVGPACGCKTKQRGLRHVVTKTLLSLWVPTPSWDSGIEFRKQWEDMAGKAGTLRGLLFCSHTSACRQATVCSLFHSSFAFLCIVWIIGTMSNTGQDFRLWDFLFALPSYQYLACRRHWKNKALHSISPPFTLYVLEGPVQISPLP